MRCCSSSWEGEEALEMLSPHILGEVLELDRNVIRAIFEDPGDVLRDLSLDSGPKRLRIPLRYARRLTHALGRVRQGAHARDGQTGRGRARGPRRTWQRP